MTQNCVPLLQTKKYPKILYFSFHVSHNFPNYNSIFIFSGVTEHKTAILERMRLDVNVRLTNLNATLEVDASCPARFVMAILTAQTVLMNGTVL